MWLLPVFHLHFLSSDSSLKVCDGGLRLARSVWMCVCGFKTVFGARP